MNHIEMVREKSRESRSRKAARALAAKQKKSEKAPFIAKFKKEIINSEARVDFSRMVKQSIDAGKWKMNVKFGGYHA